MSQDDRPMHIEPVELRSLKKVFERPPSRPRFALKTREIVSQNSFSFLISQKAVAPMSYEGRRSRDLSNGSARIARPSPDRRFERTCPYPPSISNCWPGLQSATSRPRKAAMSGCMRSAENCGAPVYSCAPAAPASHSLRIGTSNSAPFTPGKQIWRRSALRWGECAGIRAGDGKRMRRRLTEITGQFFHGCGQGGAPERHTARLCLRFTGETPHGDFSVDFLSEKDNPCHGVFSVLKYGQTPFGIWRTRIWKMATA
jgi:hypothetical protein